MLIGRQRVAGYASRTHPTLASQTKTHNHQRRQRDTVATQLNSLPTVSATPQLPTLSITPQAANGRGMGQADMPWPHPNPVAQTHKSPQHLSPGRYRKKADCDQRQRLGCKIRRQQVPGSTPAAFEKITWAGHDPGSCEPCAATPGLRTRCAP